ncbi:hypothetical protein V5799_005245 [Amblyomma americanum]|uniref:Uncharacterized protein n=1 Tax=Amblyomma americanum TaxID=6943 RepID=A0AAQ4DZT3_AMBAM
MDELLPDAEGNFNDKEYAKVCRELPIHSRCYNQLSICSDELKAKFSFFEEGYRRLRDFTCDRNELKGVYKLFACLDENLVKECTRKYLPQVSEGHYHDCREASVNSMCVDETSHQSCPMGYEASRGSFKKLNASVQMLLGCERSSQATVVPHSIIMALVAAIFFLRVQSA